MNRFILATVALLLINFNLWAQQQVAIKYAAEIMAQATLKGDYETLANYTQPKVITLMGGREKMIAVVKNGMAAMKNQGVTFKEASVGTPGKVVNTGTALYAVVPQRIVMQTNQGSISTSTSLLACSMNKGKTWYFTDAGNMTDAQLKQLFPGVLGKLVIPKRTTPVMQ